MEQGEAGDSMYLSVSGRLRAYVRQDDGTQRMVREMSRGQVIGEMSLYTDEPRSATVVAIRDSVLVRLHKSHFNQLLARSAAVSVALTRQIIQRLKTEHQPSQFAAPVTIGLIPVTDDVDLHGFADKLAAQLARIARVRVIDSAAVDDALGQPGAANGSGSDAALNRRIALLLDEIESDHDFVLLLSDRTPTPWTHRCSRHCDELLLLADATQPPALHADRAAMPGGAPAAHRGGRDPGAAARGRPALPAAAPRPGWRGGRWPTTSTSGPALERDMARLARLQSRTAVGLVLAGGGARGFAHLGVWRALRERGIEIDCVGGTSMGAVMATLVASDQPPEVGDGRSRAAPSAQPDRRLQPAAAAVADQGPAAAPRDRARAATSCSGHDADIEDLWKNYFCIATNYSQAREERCAAAT